MGKYNDIKSIEKMTCCICPKCRKRYYVKMFWTGRGTPRIYCHGCKHHSIVSQITYEEPQKVEVTL